MSSLEHNDPQVSVVVVCEDDLAELVACIEALAGHTPEGDWELVVVDNASTDQTAEFLALLEGDVVVERLAERLGYAAALRRGWELARSPLVVVLDVATLVAPGWLDALIATMDADGESTAAVAAIIETAEGDVASAGLILLPDAAVAIAGSGHPVPDDPALRGQPAAVGLECCLLRRSAVDAVGGFDSHGHRGAWLAADLSLRLTEAGHRLALARIPGLVCGRDPHVADGGRRHRVQWHSRPAPSGADDASPPVRPRSIALYLPQFHPIPENDRWWGPGFTEWTNVVQARPRFDGHEQPHLPADLGFTDLRLPDTRAAQARLAADHGVDAFCYYHYWFGRRRLLERPFGEVLASGEPDHSFALCWANEDWRANWDGRSGHVLMPQRYSPDDDDAHIAWLLEAFADPRYVRVDGRPLFAVYRAASLPDPVATTQRWRAAARAAGLGELLLCRVESFPEDRVDPRPLGFDASIEFQPDWTALESVEAAAVTEFGDTVHDYRSLVAAMVAKPEVPWRRYPCVTPQWDNTARRPRDAFIVAGATPARYEAWLRQVAELEAERAARAGEEPVVFVNAWNEWAEGAHLEPCLRWGRQFLEAHARGIGAAPPRRVRSTRTQRLEENADTLRELIVEADRAVADDTIDMALRIAQVAGDHAWYSHTGAFVSDDLERVVREIGDRLPASSPDAAAPTTRRGDEGPAVLHVLTEAHATGGHTRLAWRWMEADATRRHDAVLVNQGVIVVPDALVAAATAVHRLDQPDLGERAAALRSLAAGYDTVVLHIHPYDAVSVAALGHDHVGPTVFLNHAGHVFWLGAHAFDVVACVRPVELELAARRRGIDRDAVVLLPSMIDVEAPETDRAAARRALGLADDAVVALTVASGYKYEAGDGLGFVELMRPLLERDDRLVLVAVGPDEVGDWAALAADTDGRCRAVGRQDDLVPYVAAADFYIDSHPLTSPTSILEAALFGLPAVSFRPDGADVLGADDAGFDDAMLLPETLAEFGSAVQRLIDDVDERAERGRRLGAGVRRVHAGDHWSVALAQTYELAVTRAASRRDAPAADAHAVADPRADGDGLDERLLAVHEAGGVIRPIAEIATAHGLRLR